MRHKTLPPRGIAGVMVRGILANFAPDNQQAEVERLIEYLQDLAMSRGMEAELPNTSTTSANQAHEDATWFDAIAGELDEIHNAHLSQS